MTKTQPSQGIELHPFSAENADLVLSWRNADQVRANSLSDAVIKKEAHLSFVQGLANKPKVDFFVLFLNGKPEAVFNVDASGEDAHWGCYLSPSTAIRPGLFPLLILVAAHIAFERHKAKRLCSDVLEHNKAPQKMNAYLDLPVSGRRSVVRPTGGAVDVIEYSLPSEQFPEVQERAAKLLTRRNLKMFEDFTAAGEH